MPDPGYPVTVENASLTVTGTVTVAQPVDVVRDDGSAIASEASLLAAIVKLNDIINSLAARLGALGQATMANSTPVAIASNQSTLTVKESRPTIGTASNVAGAGASQTALASNANRLGAAFYNDSTVTCYLKCGATASASSFTVAIPPTGYYELPYPQYTGIVDVLITSGNLRVTEFT